MIKGTRKNRTSRRNFAAGILAGRLESRSGLSRVANISRVRNREFGAMLAQLVKVHFRRDWMMKAQLTPLLDLGANFETRNVSIRRVPAVEWD
jgi:hypothetical protein